MIEKYQDKRIIRHYFFVQLLYWAAYGGFTGFQALLFQGRGFTASQVGFLLSIRYFSGMTSEPMIGSFADKHPNIPIQKIMGGMLLCSLLVNICLILCRPSYLLTILLVLGLGVFELNSASLMNSIAMKYIEAGSKLNYSLARGSGSAAFAVSVTIIGLQAKKFGVESTLFTRFVLVALLAVCVLTLPLYNKHLAAAANRITDRSDTNARQGTTEPHSIAYILKTNPKFTQSLLAIFIALAALLPMSSYLSIILQSQGGGPDLVGYALFMQGLSELPSAFIYLFLIKYLSNNCILFISFVMMGLRILLTLISPGISFTIFVQMSQMLGYGLFLPASVYYAANNVSSVDRVKGQALLMVASNGLAGFCGTIIYSWTFEAGGTPLMLKTALCFIIIALGIALPSLKPYER